MSFLNAGNYFFSSSYKLLKLLEVNIGLVDSMGLNLYRFDHVNCLVFSLLLFLGTKLLVDQVLHLLHKLPHFCLLFQLKHKVLVLLLLLRLHITEDGQIFVKNYEYSVEIHLFNSCLELVWLLDSLPIVQFDLVKFVR